MAETARRIGNTTTFSMWNPAWLDENGNIDPERAETMLMMLQQDETFGDLDMAVTRVGYIDETIHEEIHMQNMMRCKIN